MSDRAKKSFKKYIQAHKEQKDCKDPCIKNVRSDRFCFECGSDMLEPFLKNL